MLNEENKSNIIPVAIEKEMKEAYLTYAMSVIVSRALPDVRDGLKPVHRRILYAMNELGVLADKPYKKSAAVVGEVLGKYHPHGDLAVYNALVRMAQDFSMRYPLIDGQGNFGSVDGDAPAAMRYTETRITQLSMEMLRDIKKDTVDSTPNYDDSLTEPSVLPAYIPNLLINGTTGIAVGMATSIPPHNINEVIDATIAIINNFDINIEEILEYIKGPDFPTRGIIYGENEIKNAYLTGRGKVTVRGRAEVEELKGNRESLIIYEIPYQVNKSELIIKIASYVRAKKIEGISDIRDESDRTGMRIVIELKKGTNSDVVLNQLFAHTTLQTTFSIIMLAIVNRRPKVLNIKEILLHYINHRKDILIRRTKFDLNKARARSHIVEGLLIALSSINEIIKLIRKSDNTALASKLLIEQFELSEKQAKAILEMRLQRLTALEINKLKKEYEELTKFISKCKEILENDIIKYKIIKEELIEAKEKYGDERKTKIVPRTQNFDKEDLIAEEENIVTISNKGFIKRLPVNTYKRQKRGGVGITGVVVKEDDFNAHLFIASTHDYIMFFSNYGRAFYTKVYEVPEGGRITKGKKLELFLKLQEGETIRACLAVKDYNSSETVMLITKKGIIKRSLISDFANAKTRGIKAINLDENDLLVSALLSKKNSHIILCTKKGKALKIKEESVRATGRNTRGVIGIRIKNNNELIGIVRTSSDRKLFVITRKGYGKLLNFNALQKHGRGTSGQIYIKTNEKTGEVIAVHSVGIEEELVISTSFGMIVKTAVKGISSFGRAASGVKVVNVKTDDYVVSVASTIPDKEDNNNENMPLYI